MREPGSDRARRSKAPPERGRDVRIVGLLLAAGRGERFGGAKLLAPLPAAPNQIDAGTPVGVAACRHLVAALPETVAVVRPGDEALAQALSAAGATIVECARADEGMGASLACGVAAVADADGWVVALADMPWVRPSTIAAVADALRDGADIAAPSYRGERGNPVGFARPHCAALVALGGDEGARAIVAAHRASVVLCATGDPGVLRDVDRRADLERT
jgi:molybdenum cofactor cytidylyltransferase